MAELASTLVIFSEVILSSYPILIKKVNVDIGPQLVARMGVFMVGAATVLLSLGGNLAGLITPATVVTGILNFLHVSGSYVAFKLLSAGDAMAIFYTNPVWNVIGACTVLGEPWPDWATTGWMALALFGAVLVSSPTGESFNAAGVAAALLSSMTEAAIFVFFKAKETASQQQEGFALTTESSQKSENWHGSAVTSMKRMTQMYIGSAMILLLILLLLRKVWSSTGAVKSNNWTPLLLFNLFVGFVGYAIRFIVIPHLPTAVFSTLTLFGLVAAYVFGYIFVGEKLALMPALGSVCIVVANWFMMSRSAARG